MYATRIDRKLSAKELHKALIYANGAFQEYLGLLHALFLYNCTDGAEIEQHLFQVPMIFRATKTKLEESQKGFLNVSNGHLIYLDNIEIDPDAYFRESDFYLLNPSDGLTIPPLSISSLGWLFRINPIVESDRVIGSHYVRCYAIKIAIPPKPLNSSFDHEPVRYRAVDDVRRIKTPDEIPDGLIVAPEIIVSPNTYFGFLMTLEEILCYRLMPLQPLFPTPISTPVFTHCNVVFPNGDGIFLPRLNVFPQDKGYGKYLPRLNVFKDEFSEDELPRFSDIAKPLLTYESHTRMMLALIEQEVNRRLAGERSKDERAKTAAVISFNSQATPSAPNGNKSRIRHNIPIADAAKRCDVTERTVERWLAGKHAPAGFPGLNDSGVFLAWVEEYRGRKAIFSGKHKTGNTRKAKGGYDAIMSDKETDT